MYRKTYTSKDGGLGGIYLFPVKTFAIAVIVTKKSEVM